jgi:hypothetical protein
VKLVGLALLLAISAQGERCPSGRVCSDDGQWILNGSNNPVSPNPFWSGYDKAGSAWILAKPCNVGEVYMSNAAGTYVCVAANHWTAMPCDEWHGYCLHQPSLPIPKELQ